MGDPTSGDKVVDGFSTAEGWGDDLYPWEAQVDLRPGARHYTFVALTDDPSDGEGSARRRTEDHHCLVKLSPRRLNRTLLQRQHLLARATPRPRR